MKPFTLRKGPLAGMRVEAAPSAQTEMLDAEVQRVLDALGYPEAFVTDLSAVGDFSLSDQELADVGKRLGFTITHDDAIIDIAVRLKGAN